MKKILTLIIAVLLLFSSFGFTVNAIYYEDTEIFTDEICELPKEEIITFSDDYKNLFVGDQSYSRCNIRYISGDLNFKVINKIDFNNIEVNEVTLYSNKKGNVINATIFYSDGSSLDAGFIDENYLDEYNSLLNNSKEEHIITIDSINNNIINVNLSKLKGKKVNLKTDDFYYNSNSFSVDVEMNDKSIAFTKGEIHIQTEKIYYYDFSENNNDIYYEDDQKEYVLYEIVDSELIEEIRAALDLYYDEYEYGIFLDDNFAEKVSIVFFVFGFIILPFIVIVLGIFLFVRSRGIYRKMYAIICGLSLLEIIIFAIISWILFR